MNVKHYDEKRKPRALASGAFIQYSQKSSRNRNASPQGARAELGTVLLSKKLSCSDQFLAMAFAQLTYRESLRDIEACLGSVGGKLNHMKFRGKAPATDSLNSLTGFVASDPQNSRAPRVESEQYLNCHCSIFPRSSFILECRDCTITSA